MIRLTHSRLFLIFVAVLALTGCKDAATNAQPTEPEAAPALPEIAADAPDRFPVEVDGHWGYIDRDGRIVIEPRFDAAHDFHEGLAAVQIDGAYGYIDRDGTTVVEPLFEHVGIFADGLAAVMPSAEDGMIGFIDTSGTMILDAAYGPASYFPGNPEVSYFSEGLAPVRPMKGADTIGFIDRDGEWVIDPSYRDAGTFAHGTAPVRNSSAHWSFIDRDGTIVLEGDWTRARPFSEGRAAVATKVGNRQAWLYIDDQGNAAASPTFGSGGSQPERAQSFSGGLAAVYYDGPDRWEYILPDGERADFVTVEPHRWFDEASPFRGGLARVELLRRRQGRGGTGETIYIDRLGNQVWPSPTPEQPGNSPLSDDSTITCPDQECWSEHFADCRPARFSTGRALGGRAEYSIEGPAENGCRVSMTFLENMNPEWVGKPLLFTLDSTQEVEPQLQQAVEACLTGEGNEYECGGPLLSVSGVTN